jgi:predicted DNA-binding protein
MPSQKTRVALTLPDEVVEVLDRMSKVSGAGRATIVRSWLIEGLPVLQGLAEAMELASQKNVDGFRVITETLRNVVGEAEQLGLDLRPPRRAAMRRRTPKAPKDQGSA